MVHDEAGRPDALPGAGGGEVSIEVAFDWGHVVLVSYALAVTVYAWWRS